MPTTLWSKCLDKAFVSDRDATAVAVEAMEVGLEFLSKQKIPPSVKHPWLVGPRDNGSRAKALEPITYYGGSLNPAAEAGLKKDKPCWSCNRQRPFDGGWMCPSCRQRAGQRGWCACGAALYATGCFPRNRRQRKAHRDHTKSKA